MLITLPLEQVNTVLAGLGELPLKVSLEAYISVRQQAEAQVQAAAQPAEPVEPVEPGAPDA